MHGNRGWKCQRGLLEAISGSPKDLFLLQDGFFALRGECTALRPGVDALLMGHTRELRDEVAALWDTHSVSQKDLSQLQDDVLALRSERSSSQPGVDVFVEEHAQDDLTALYRKFARNNQNDFVSLVDTDGINATPKGGFGDERSRQSGMVPISRQMAKPRRFTPVNSCAGSVVPWDHLVKSKRLSDSKPHHDGESVAALSKRFFDNHARSVKERSIIHTTKPTCENKRGRPPRQAHQGPRRAQWSGGGF